MSSPPPKHSLSSPTSGNTPHPVLPTPSSSTSVSIRQNNKTSQLRQELEQQLADKQKQLQESSSGIGKNVLARQVSQLQDRIKEIDSTINNPTTNDDIQPVSVDRLRSLERDLTSYRNHPLSPGISSIRNKEKLLNQRSTSGLDPLPSPSTSTLLPPTHGHDSTSLLPLPPPPTGSTPTKRRSKIPNTDRRNTDIEFATEIGQGLLLEVRKMQALLQEKEEKLRTLENQKADLERAAEAMAKQMRQREENEEKLKEETWNLELAKQELTISVTELQQNLSKANVEQNKLDKQVNVLRSEIEKLRDKEEKMTNTIDTMKQRHEQDMSSIRRHAAAIQREKSDQSKQIDALTSELAIAKAQSRIGKHVTTDTELNTRSGETTDDQATTVLAVKSETSPSSSPPSSPKQAPTRNQAMEVETLKTSLAHAHRMVSNLRSNLHKEKTEKFEFKKLLADSQETIEQLQNDPRMWVDAGPTRGASGSSSNIASKEDGLGSGRRSHKASISTSSKRRGSRKTTSGRTKPKGSQHATADDDSVYSYSSMSDPDDSEDVDSFDDSDVGFDSTISKKKTVGFTALSSELSRSQSQNPLQKPVVVDAEVNTDPMDDTTTESVTRSLGDELGMAMSQKSPEETSVKDVASGILAGLGAAVGVDALSKPAGVQMLTQTDVYDEPKTIPGTQMMTQTEPERNEVSIQTESSKLEKSLLPTMSVEPTKPVDLELVSQTAIFVEPEDPSLSLAAAAAATSAAIAASRSKAIEEAIDCFVQSDPIDNSAEIKEAVTASRFVAFENAIHSSVQSDPIDPSIALAETAAAIAASRSDAIKAAVNASTQSEEPIEDPSVALAALAASEAATAAAITEARSKALEAAVNSSTQSEEPEPVDPAIALAEKAGIIAAARAEAFEAAVHCSTQSDEPELVDPSVALAATAAAIAEARAKALEAAVHCSTQSDELEKEDPSIALAAAIDEARAKALEAAVHCSTQSDEPEKEDPSFALAATAVAIAEARSKALEAAVHCSTQSDEPEVEDPSIALAKTAEAAAALRAAALESAIHNSTQCDPEDPSVAAAAIAAAIKSSRAAALESAISTSTQFEEEEDPSIAAAAAEAAAISAAITTAAAIAASRIASIEAAINASTQSEGPSVVSQETQVEHSQPVNTGVQSIPVVAVDADVQHQMESTDIAVQHEQEKTGHGVSAILPIPPVSSRTFSDSEDEFFDADSKPTSRRTVDSATFSNLKPESRKSNLSEQSIESKLMPKVLLGDNQKPVSAEHEDASSLKKNAIIGAAAATSVINNNKSVQEHDKQIDALLSVPSDVNTLAVGDEPLDNKSYATTQPGQVTDTSDIQEIGNASPAEMMFSKAETDALIATAVALALKNAGSLKLDDTNNTLSDDVKRHTCDMSNNEKSANVTPVSDITKDLEKDDEDQHDEDYGNVLIHSPREEDTITSLPYDETAQRHRDRFILPAIDSSRVDFFENLKPKTTEPEKVKPELSVGPSIVFSQAPDEPEEREITAADVPQRPANPPPHELLNKAGLSSTFTDSRSMSPSSLRSKGKGPMEYSDLESMSPRSHDDLQRTAVLQQHHLDAKRGSVDASSVSTSNTNEQLRSLNSSQYDVVTRGTGSTDPMINLITKTMIGDWLYKYTRKAVGGGLSEKSHKRYFWFHPYTHTLYWSVTAPGLNGNEAKAKSALIENITSVPNYSYATDGTPNVSLLIQTSHRQIKVTAPTMEKHDIWFEAITHLLSRDKSGKGLTFNDTKKAENPNNRSVSSGTSGSLLNRPSFRRLHDIFQQPSSAQSMSTTEDHVEFEYDDDDEALEDVRMCCNGKHHVSKLEKDHAHRHQNRKRKSRATITTT